MIKLNLYRRLKDGSIEDVFVYLHITSRVKFDSLDYLLDMEPELVSNLNRSRTNLFLNSVEVFPL